jgi:hypothetical protein
MDEEERDPTEPEPEGEDPGTEATEGAPEDHEPEPEGEDPGRIEDYAHEREAEDRLDL